MCQFTDAKYFIVEEAKSELNCTLGAFESILIV